MPAIRIHPQNPKLFEFRGQPRVLVTATEHYGAVMNRPFRYEPYLADAADKGITFTRLFTLFRELQTAINPYSTCKPESPDYVAPFVRVGPGRALDGEPKYDLDRPNPEFFDRLHGFLSLAADYGIIVEIVLLSNVYTPEVWGLNPLHPQNNLCGWSDIPWYETMTRRHSHLFERQMAHVRSVVEQTNRYDNVVYEICNEPFGGFADKPNGPPVEEVDAWLNALIQTIRDTEATLPERHLIFGQQAYSWQPFEQGADKAFQSMDYDAVNMHPLPQSTYKGVSYHLGDFMSKQLTLRALRDYGLATYNEHKPLNQDEDNVASQYKDDEAWTIHRKRAWVTLLSGGHYDYIDFSILPGMETGTPASNRAIRTWMGWLATFMHSLDLLRAHPLPDLLKSQPAHILEIGFGVPGEDLVIYLADERELTSARRPSDLATMMPGVVPSELIGISAKAGQPISGEIVLDLPTGSYTVACFDPKTGQYSPAILLQGGANTRLTLPTFVHDLVVRIRRQELSQRRW